MKRYFDINYNGEPYDALTRRKNAELYYIAGGNKVNKMDNAGRVPASTGGPSKPTTIGRGAKPLAGGTRPGAGAGTGASGQPA